MSQSSNLILRGLGTHSPHSALNDHHAHNKKSKYLFAVCAIAEIAGIIIITLSGLNLFGPIGSMSFIGSMTGGGVIICIATGGIVWQAIVHCKGRKQAVQPREHYPREKLKPSKDLKTKNSSEQSERADTVLHDLVCKLQKDEDITKVLQSIPKEFFEQKSQERAKSCFSEVMQQILNAKVTFPKAGPLEQPENLQGQLDCEVFQLSITSGVQEDILRSACDQQHIHVYQVASQYNASEAPTTFTPKIGTAMSTSQGDHTQGPLAQRTNPVAFELVTAFLTHLGFNMLNTVLPSCGKTYEKGAQIEHGYLLPKKQTIDTVTNEFKEAFSHAEYVCYSSHLNSWDGGQPVYLFLQSAPAIGYADPDIKDVSDELQKYAALANYLALFRHGITLARETGQPIVLHAAAVGCGVFGNKVSNMEWGFEKAALALQSQMKAVQVTVQLEAYKGSGPMVDIAVSLNIPAKKRIGD